MDTDVIVGQWKVESEIESKEEWKIESDIKTGKVYVSLEVLKRRNLNLHIYLY